MTAEAPPAAGRSPDDRLEAAFAEGRKAAALDARARADRGWPVRSLGDAHSEVATIAELLGMGRETLAGMAFGFALPDGRRNTELDRAATLLIGAHTAAERLHEQLGEMSWDRLAEALAAQRRGLDAAAPPAEASRAEPAPREAAALALRARASRGWAPETLDDIHAEVRTAAELLAMAREQLTGMDFQLPDGRRNADLARLEVLVCASHGTVERLREGIGELALTRQVEAAGSEDRGVPVNFT